MAWKAILNTGAEVNSEFRDIDYAQMKKLVSLTCGEVELDIENGEIRIDGEYQTRQQAMNHYYKGPYKPIQYRKVVNYIGMYDWDKLDEELAEAEKTPVIHEMTKLAAKRRESTITEDEMAKLGLFLEAWTGEIPFREFEVQVIGYAYEENGKKIQVELTCDPEIESVTMKVIITDLLLGEKQAPQFTRLK